MDDGVTIIADPAGKGYGFAFDVYNYVVGKKERNFKIDLNNIHKTRFKDGEYKIKIEDNLRRRRCFFIHDPNTGPVEWVCDLLFTLDAIAGASPSEINVVFPYIRYSRQDKKDESRISVNAKAIANVVNMYAHRTMGLDLHSSQIQGYFDRPFDNLQSNPVVIDYIKKNYGNFLENLVLVSPDIGGSKRMEAFQKRLSKEDIEAEIAIGYKRRKKENEVGEINIMGKVKNKNCLIIDDIIDTGRTLIKTAKSLRYLGAKKLWVWGTHGVFSEERDLKIFDKIMVSNSLYIPPKRKLEVISVDDLFGEAIYRTIVGESLSSLFE